MNITLSKQATANFKHLLNKKNAEVVEDREEANNFWEYYRTIDGFLNGSYFDVHFMFHDNKLIAKISSQTGCIRHIEKLLRRAENKQFSFTIVNKLYYC